ncbi:hypothetical protein CMK11_22250 [Candidatus Poribacteria bacterium]|nr:hypothetical protein [Candidatus Poribacteria bacterium]
MADATVEATSSPNMTRVQPVFRIEYEEAVAHYVDWLGFAIDWEWRREPGAPVEFAATIQAVSVLTEFPEYEEANRDR